MDLRHYGSSTVGQDLYLMGDLKFVMDDAYEYRSEEGGKMQIVRIERTPHAGQPQQLTSRGLMLGTGPIKIDGLFLPISAEERVKRGQARWTKSDAALNQQFAVTKAEVGLSGTPKLRELQRDWIKWRDDRAEGWTHDAEPLQYSPEYWQSMLEDTVDRIEFLQVYTGKTVPAGLTGAYRDFHGGSLELEETKGGLKFSVDVVRRHSAANGGLSGMAKRQGEIANYREVVETGGDRPPTQITFDLRGGHVVKVTGQNTGYYHGAGAYFDGEYYKVGSLTKPIDLRAEH